MRQAGILAAGALFALDHLRDRIVEDHQAANAIAAALGDLEGVSVVAPETNIVNVDVPGDAEAFARVGAEHGALFSATGPNRLRLVTHLDVSGDVSRIIEVLLVAFKEAL
ncbi:hypothetical protein JYT22_01265 [Endomicrobium sp. AH-315-J14]|nr:hypothetical protein [Endomicrobium sp. AH-315-J14]